MYTGSSLSLRGNEITSDSYSWLLRCFNLFLCFVCVCVCVSMWFPCAVRGCPREGSKAVPGDLVSTRSCVNMAFIPVHAHLSTSFVA